MSTVPAPAWCGPWCTREHSATATAAELCGSEPVTIGLVRFEESGHEGWLDVAAETVHNLTTATSTRIVCISGSESITMTPERATTIGVALIQAAGLHTATGSVTS